MTTRSLQLTRRDVATTLAGLAAMSGLAAGSPAMASPPAGAPRADASALPIRVERGKPYLTDAKGNPFLLHGDTAWSLIGDLTREDALHYLDDRHRRGFNTLVVSLIEFHYARNAPRNAEGEAPFASPTSMSAPREAYFRHADWVIEQAEQRGMLLLLAPAYLGLTGGHDGWYPLMQATGAEQLRAYGRYVGRRYAGRRNIIWMHGGDANPKDRSLSAAVAEGIREEAPSALQTAHCGPEVMAIEYWGDHNWLGLNTLYTYKPVHLQAEKARAFRARMPSILVESAYEDETGTGVPAADAHRVRTQAFQALLGGACGHVFGNNPIWHFDGPGMSPAPTGWKAALASPGTRSMEVFSSLISELSWWTLEAAPQIITSGAGSDADRAVAAAAPDGELAVVYGPSSRKLALDLRALKGPAISARWLDPATGAATGELTMSHESRPLAVMPPKFGGSAGPDWLLVLRSKTT